MQFCYCVIVSDKHYPFKDMRYPFGDGRESAITFANIKRKEGYKVKIVREAYDDFGKRIDNKKGGLKC